MYFNLIQSFKACTILIHGTGLKIKNICMKNYGINLYIFMNFFTKEALKPLRFTIVQSSKWSSIWTVIPGELLLEHRDPSLILYTWEAPDGSSTKIRQITKKHQIFLPKSFNESSQCLQTVILLRGYQQGLYQNYFSEGKRLQNLQTVEFTYLNIMVSAFVVLYHSGFSCLKTKCIDEIFGNWRILCCLLPFSTSSFCKTYYKSFFFKFISSQCYDSAWKS